VLLHLGGVFGDDHFVCAETLAIFDLVGRGGEEHGVSAERVGEFDSHVAESAETDDSYFLAGPDFPVMQR
jgi:hypothetical protein